MKGRILLVEPDASLRESLARIRGVDGYEVSEAASRRVALDSIQAARPDAVVVAAELPDGSALDFVGSVKQIGSEIPCTVLARYEELEVAAQAIQSGAEQFLTKPVQLPAFLLVVDRALENQRNRRRIVGVGSGAAFCFSSRSDGWFLSEASRPARSPKSDRRHASRIPRPRPPIGSRTPIGTCSICSATERRRPCGKRAERAPLFFCRGFFFSCDSVLSFFSRAA